MAVKVKVSYRADRRLQLVEIRSGKIAFLVSLTPFELLTGVDTEDVENRRGTISIEVNDYKLLYLQKEKVG